MLPKCTIFLAVLQMRKSIIFEHAQLQTNVYCTSVKKTGPIASVLNAQQISTLGVHLSCSRSLGRPEPQF
jgi:hypothetical protein